MWYWCRDLFLPKLLATKAIEMLPDQTGHLDNLYEKNFVTCTANSAMGKVRLITGWLFISTDSGSTGLQVNLVAPQGS